MIVIYNTTKLMSDAIVKDSAARKVDRDVVSHHKVYEVYKSLIEKPGRGRLPSKGRTYYHEGEVDTYSNTSNTFTIGENNYRKTSFTEEQEKYNDLVRVELRDAIINEETGFLAKFKKRWDKEGSQTNFEDILTETYIESIFEAFDNKPNLTPAFFGFLVASNAGADGLQVALNESLYPRDVIGDSLPGNYKTFVGVHSAKNDNVMNWEVQCGAPALAMKIIAEGQKCTRYAGLKVDDLDNTRFGGPSSNVADKIRTELASRMKNLGYETK